MATMLCTFNENCTRFATVSADNRLKIWDISGQQLHHLQESSHLATRYTAIAWSPNRRSKANASDGGIIAVGTQKGLVLLWDLTSGSIIHKLGAENEGHNINSHITSLSFNDSGTLLFSSAEDKNIVQWNVETGRVVAKFPADKHAITSLSVSPDNSVLATASSQVVLWDLASLRKMHKHSGHTKPVVSMNFAPDGKHLLTTAGDRFVNLWSTSAADSTSQVFISGYNPMYLECNHKRKKTSQFDILALSDSGLVCVWHYDERDHSDKKTKEVQKPIEARGQIRANVRIIHAHFCGPSEIAIIMLDGAQPICQRVRYRDEETDDIIETVTLQTTSAGQKGRQTTVHGTAAEDQQEGAKRNKKNIRMARLGLADQQTLPHISSGTETEKQEMPKIPMTSKQYRNMPAESLGRALEQALNSGDFDMLNRVLEGMNAGNTAPTVRELSPKAVLAFLPELIRRFRRYPDKGYHVMMVLKALLTEHSGLLMVTPSAVDYLQPLYMLLEARLASYSSFMALSGRLDLVLSQVNQRAAKAQLTSRRSITVFQEESDDEEDEDEDEEDENEAKKETMKEDEDEEEDEEDESEDDKEESEADGMSDSDAEMQAKKDDNEEDSSDNEEEDVAMANGQATSSEEEEEEEESD